MKVSITKAAQAAEVSTRTIWNWLRQYKLTRHTMGDKTLVELGEVNAVLDGKNRVAPTPQLLSVIIRRLEKIEREVEVLLYSGGYTPLMLSEDQAVLAYQVAEQQSKRKSLTDVEIEELTTMVAGITEETLELIQVQRDIVHPWRPFYDLVNHLQKLLKAKKKFETDLTYQQIYMRLVKARNRLRDIAMIFIAADTDTSVRTRLATLMGPSTVLESEILRRIVWKKSKELPFEKKEISEKPHELLTEALEILDEEGSDRTPAAKIVRRLEKVITLLQK